MNVVELRKVIKRPLITEKGSKMKDDENKYLFEVDMQANKMMIREAVEKLFDVKVLKVSVMRVHGKEKRMGRYSGHRSDWKKAIVTLKAGDEIELFEGV
jgi:large subunit ribosomal protein L23